MEKQEESGKILVELKVKVDDLNSVRTRLEKLKPRVVGSFEQIDTYYRVNKGRLKVREVIGNPEVQVIYYHRKNIRGPKRSDILIFEAKPASIVNQTLESILGIRIVVKKRREIYRYKGTQIHLDRVKGLGSYVEFERPTRGTRHSISKDRKTLESLFALLKLDSEKLQAGSYSDLLETATTE